MILDEISSNIQIININKISQVENKLITSNEYLPTLLRKYISSEYYSNLRSTDKLDNILEKVTKTRKQGTYLDYIEFAKWINEHKEYDILLNKDNFKEWEAKTEIISNTIKKI